MKYTHQMHEGKQQLELQFPAIGKDLPFLPYKDLKKELKHEGGPMAFETSLRDFVRASDAEFRAKAGACLKARSPALLNRLAYRAFTSEPAPAPEALVKWADLNATGLRKILKKYRKKTTSQTELPALLARPSFVASRHLTELQALALLRSGQAPLGAGTAASTDAPEGSDGSDQASAFPLQKECSVCLEIMVRPTAPACGHAVCGACAAKLQRMRRDGRTTCPLCRSVAIDQTTAMPQLCKLLRRT